MQTALNHIDLAIEALRRSHPSHLMLMEMRKCRATLVILQRAELSSNPRHTRHVRRVARVTAILCFAGMRGQYRYSNQAVE
jgi:hypothetical protein